MRRGHLYGKLLSLLIPVLLSAVVDKAESAQQFQGVCAVSKIEISQELTLERIGFLASLEITNNEVDASITNFSARIGFGGPSDADPSVLTDRSDRFFVKPPKLFGVDAIDGSGVIAPGQTARIEWFIIPKVSAGGTDIAGVQYFVGADLGGSIYGEPITPELLDVIPGTIRVRPEPQLEITYFQPRDVTGDDPFTVDVVESPIPFTLGVLVKNGGYGRANRVTVQSEQPRIVENLQNLLLIPKLLGARVDDDPTDERSLTLTLGDIEPGRCRKGAWDMITSLSGEFVEFTASYTHDSDLGGVETSIIKSLNAYFILHEVLNDQPGRDGLLDFLADTVGDPERRPDFLYESDCNVLPVNTLTNVQQMSYEGMTAVFRANANFENWVYFRVDDPAQAIYAISEVLRSDGKILNPNNYWTEVRYRESDNQKLTYLNVFDRVSLGTYDYIVTYVPPPADLDPPVTRLRFDGPVESANGKYYITPETRMFFTVQDASPVGTWYDLDSSGTFLPGYPFWISVPGEHLVEFYSSDQAGNEELHQTATLVLSGEAPVITTFTSDTDVLYVPGDSISTRPVLAGFLLEASTTGASLTGTVEVYRGVRAAASVSGVPASPTPDTGAVSQVSGPFTEFYKYRLGSDPWSGEEPVTTPITLSGLSPGVITLSVVGRNGKGVYPPESDAVTVTWTVDPDWTEPGVTGTPPTPTASGEANLSIAGSPNYCYRVDGAFYQPNLTPGEAITLSGLAEGLHTVEVLGRQPADPCPGDVVGSLVSWTVDRAHGTRFPESDRVRTQDLGVIAAAPVAVSWDGRDDDGHVVASGWYSVKVTVSDGLGRATSMVRLVEVGDLMEPGVPVSDAGGAGQALPHVSGGWMVWQDQRSGDWDVYARDLIALPGVVVAITSEPLNQQRPRTDGRYVVWEAQQADGSWDIGATELGVPDPAFLITSSPDRDELKPVVSWPWVVYQWRSVANPGAPWQLEAYDLRSGTTEAIDASAYDQKDPAISGHYLVWNDFRDLGPGEIYLKDLFKGTVRRITEEPAGQLHPTVSGHWIVWEDNRNTEVDLYGYDLLRNAEIRLTNTPEDEAQPSLNGQWVIYTEDSSGESLRNLRLLHLAVNAVIPLTSQPSEKSQPGFADGTVAWADNGGGTGVIVASRLPDLQPVFRNRNAVVVTDGMVNGLGDAYSLLTLWNREAGIAEVTHYTSLVPLVVETASWNSGAPAGINFALTAGDYVWVQFDSSRILDLSRDNCSPMDLAQGENVKGYACFPDGYSAYGLMRELGTANVNAVRHLSSDTGLWEVATLENGEITGEDFSVPRISVLVFDMFSPVPAWTPGR